MRVRVGDQRENATRRTNERNTIGKGATQTDRQTKGKCYIGSRREAEAEKVGKTKKNTECNITNVHVVAAERKHRTSQPSKMSKGNERR